MRAVLNIIALICVAIWAYGYFTGADKTIHILLIVAVIVLGFRIIIEIIEEKEKKYKMEEQNTLSDALDWFFAKTEVEKHNLKDKHFPNEYIAHDSQWGFHFTLAQIKQMYVKDCGDKKTEKRLGGFFRYTIDDDGNMTIKEKINLDIKK